MDEDKVSKLFKQLIEDGLGLDLTDPNLVGTPKRLAKMYCRELFKNVNKEFTKVTVFPNEENYNQIIMLDRIEFISMCSHHFLPFTGYGWFLYIPDKWLVGASKPARIINHYSSKPQLQENLGHEAMECFIKAVKPLGAMLFLRAGHSCMSCRGVKQSAKSGMSTSVLKGIFLEEPILEQKGLDMIRISLMEG